MREETRIEGIITKGLGDFENSQSLQRTKDPKRQKWMPDHGKEKRLSMWLHDSLLKSPKLKNIEVFTYINNFSKRLRYSSQIYQNRGPGRLKSILPQKKPKVEKGLSEKGLWIHFRWNPVKIHSRLISLSKKLYHQKHCWLGLNGT